MSDIRKNSLFSHSLGTRAFTVSLVGLSLLASAGCLVWPFYRQAQCVEKITIMGGRCELRYSQPKVTKWLLGNRSTYFSEYHLVDFQGISIDGSDIRLVEQVIGVEILVLDDTSIKSEDLARLHKLPNLYSLHLAHITLDEDAMKHIAKCESLQVLYLTGAEFSMNGLAKLQSLDLVCLDISSTKVDDEAVGAIAKSFPNLGILSIVDTRITSIGVKELKRLLPRCRIEVSEKQWEWPR